MTETNEPLRAMARRAVGYRKRIAKLDELLRTVLDRWTQAPSYEPIFDASRGKWLAVSPNNLRVVLAERDEARADYHRMRQQFDEAASIASDKTDLAQELRQQRDTAWALEDR